MTKVRFIGDVHGKFGPYKKLIKDVSFSMQVGDMGVGFRKLVNDEIVWSTNPPFDAMSKGRHLFVRGNHDNPAVCRQQKFWIPDGSLVDDKIFCLGGAVSIDRHMRKEGLDWWADEECSMSDLYEMVDKYIATKPEIVMTHECPSSIADEIMSNFRMGRVNDGSRTRNALEAMFYYHQPKLWVFGHWHTSMRFVRNGTKFVCLAELEYMDVEI